MSRRAQRGLMLRLRGVSLHRDGRRILEDLHWCLHEGERWVLQGANGAGKTQLLKLLAGAVWPDPQTLEARQYFRSGRRKSLPEVIDEICYLGPERQDRHERYAWNFTALEVVGTGLARSDIPQGPLRQRQRAQALRYLSTVGMRRLAARRFLELSFGERRLVLLARALAHGGKWLLLDELFAGLDARHRARMLRALSRHRGSWVLSTHRSEEIPLAATHLAVIRDGRLVSSGPITTPLRKSRQQRNSTVDASTVGSDDLGRASEAGRAQTRFAAQPLASFEGADVYLDYRAVLRGLTFSIAAGECWVIHGANGSGKSTLLRTLYGDHPVALGGKLWRRGIAAGVPLTDFRSWCAIVAPHLQANPPPAERVLDNVVSGLRSSIGLDEPPSGSERRSALAALEALGLRAFADLPLRTLSYGQVRRVLFARAFVLQPKLLLLDEALAGIDVDTRHALRTRIEAFVANGGTAVMVSHHRDEWPGNVTHELELAAGRMHYAGPVRRARSSRRSSASRIGTIRPARG